jgi:DNA-binding NtrC family response regulator
MPVIYKPTQADNPLFIGGNGSTSRPAILVVDDHAGVRKMLQLALSGSGFIVHLAANGNDAVDIYRRHHIDLVLMEIDMPRRNGVETLLALMKVNPQVVCCFMAAGIGDNAEELFCLGAAAFIHKPFRLDELRELIWHCVAR